MVLEWLDALFSHGAKGNHIKSIWSIVFLIMIFIRTELDADCKQWRLFADLLNDCALTLELCAPYVVGAIGASSREVTALLCVSGVAKSIVGVAGGATRAALTHHQVSFCHHRNISIKLS